MKRALLRDRILVAVCSAIVAAIVVAISVTFSSSPKIAVDTIELPVATASKDRWAVQFLGDTMLGDGAQPYLDANGYEWPLSGVRSLLDGDVVVANAEAPISLQTLPANPGKPYSYNSDPRAAAALRAAGVDVLGLGNNHSMDMGLAGLLDTVGFAAANDLAAFGAGENLAQAERPLMLRSAMGTVGVVALGENYGKTSKAAIDTPGTVVLSPRTVQRGFDLAKAGGADWVVGYVHWGDNYTETMTQQRYWAQMFVDAGYDLVVGTGPHISAPIEFIDGVPVAFSIGNFVFGAPGRFEGFGKEGFGLSLSVELSRAAPAQLAVRCFLTDNLKTGFLPQPCNEEETQAIMPTINTGLIVNGNTARISCGCFKSVSDVE